jgi:hypothetical protein
VTNTRALPYTSHEVDQVNGPNDPAKPAPAFTPISQIVPAVAWDSRRGRQYELDRTETGTLNVAFDNSDLNNILQPEHNGPEPMEHWRTYMLTSPHEGNVLNDANAGLLSLPVSAVTGNFDTASNAPTVDTAFTGTSAVLSGPSGFLGTKCATLTGTAVTSLSIGYFGTGTAIPMMPGVDYLVSVMVLTTFASPTITLGLSSTYGSATISTTLATSTVSGAWTRLSGVVSNSGLGASTNVAMLVVVNATGASSGSALSIDCLVVEPVGRTNLCTNPSFEVGTTASWAAGSNVTPSVASGKGYGGGNALLLTKGGSAGGNAYVVFTNYTVTAGQAYTLSAYVSSTTGSPVSGSIVLGDNGAQTIVNFTTPATGYSRVSVTRTMGTSVSPTAYLTLDPAPAGSTAYFDNVLLELAPAVGSYFDGDAELCYWTGSHQASTGYMPNAKIPGGGTAAVPAPIRYNAHPNPSFQTSTAGWSGTALTRLGAGCPFIGSQFRARASASTSGAVTYAGIPVQASTEMLLSAWVRMSPNYFAANNATATVTLTYSWYTSGAALISNQSTNFTLDQSGWTRLATVVTSPATAATVTFGLSWPSFSYSTPSIDMTGFLVECYNQGRTNPGGSVTRPHFDSYTGAKFRPVFGGFVERWPQQQDTDLRPVSQLTVIDSLGALALIDGDSEYSENVRDSSPYMYYPLGEPQGSKAFGEATGNGVRNIHGSYGWSASPMVVDAAGDATGAGTQAGQPGPQDTVTATTNGGNAGATINVPQVPAFGDAGTAVEFSGVAQTLATNVSVDFPYAQAPGRTSLACEGWVYLTAAGVTGNSIILTMDNDFYSCHNIVVYVPAATTNVAFLIQSGTNSSAVGTLATSATLNTWHHFAVSRWYDGTNYHAIGWWDGVQVANTTVAPTATAGGPWGNDTVAAGDTVWGYLALGGYNTTMHEAATSGGFPGRVAHVAFYGTVLTHDAVASRYWHGRRGGLGETASMRARRYLNRYYNQPWQVEGAATMTVASAATATTVSVDSTLGFATGQKVIVTNGAYANTAITSQSTQSGVLGTGTTYEGYAAELMTVSTVDPTANTVTFTAGLAKAHSVGTYLMVGTQLSANAAVTTKTKLLPILQGVEVAEQGWFFAKADGRPYFMLRTSRYQTAANVAKLNFVQLGNHGVPYLTGSRWGFDPTLLYSVITVTRTDSAGSTTYTIFDQTAVNKFFRRELSVSLPIASDTEAGSAASYLLSVYSTASERVEEVNVDLYANPLIADKVLALELGDYVICTKYLLGVNGPQGVDYSMIVENIALRAEPGILTATLRLSPGSKSSTYAYDNALTYR